MATTVEYIEYVCGQLNGNYAVRYKKMFGEYMVYVNDKPVLLVCGNCVFIKMHNDLVGLMSEAEVGIPYDGAKEHYILDVENRELTEAVIEVLDRVTPLPKQRKKK